MTRPLRALLMAAAATTVAALVLKWLPGWTDRPSGTVPPQPSREEIVDELSDRDKERLLRELGLHV